MARAYLGGRIVAVRRTALLAAGDVVAILLFATLGELRHGGTVVEVLLTAVEFGVGWAVAAVALGAYGERALDSIARAAGIAVAAWVVGAVIGAVVRVAVEPTASLAPVFVLVTAVTGAAILALWRSIATRLL